MGLIDRLIGGKKAVNSLERGGYLELYGLWDWYTAQTEEVQKYLYKSSGYGLNTDPKNLICGHYQIFHMPNEFDGAAGTERFSELYDKYWPESPNSIIAISHKQHIPTATSFLCGHARNAFLDRQHEIARVLLAEANRRISDEWDQAVYTLVVENHVNTSASEKEITAAVPLVARFLRENPGFLQSQLPKQFDGIKEDAIGMAAYRLRQDGKIRREKKGRSFQLWVVE